MAGPVRQPIDLNQLSRYLKRNASQITLPIECLQFGYGQSNPTYQLKAADGQKYVLRKKPPGQLLSKTAHQVDREYRIIRALANTGVPVPRTYCLCEDKDVIGTVFYVMEFLDGRIFDDASFPNVPPHDRREMWRDALRVLGKLHRVDPCSVGLTGFGKPSGFYNRQIRTLSAISTSQAQTVDIENKQPVGDIPHFDETVSFLKGSTFQPTDRGTIIHGDYKIDNLVYHHAEPKVIGILDWEMSTIGHPLSDLANLLSPYCFAVDPPISGLESRTNRAFSPSNPLPVLPTQEQCIGWYAEVAEWDPGGEVDWGHVFATFRNCVIMQGIAARYAQRQASSEQAKEIGGLMRPYGQFTFGLIDRFKRKKGAVEEPSCKQARLMDCIIRGMPRRSLCPRRSLR